MSRNGGRRSRRAALTLVPRVGAVAVALVAVAACGGGMGKLVVSGAEVYAATMGTSSADVRSTFSFGTGSSTVARS